MKDLCRLKGTKEEKMGNCLSKGDLQEPPPRPLAESKATATGLSTSKGVKEVKMGNLLSKEGLAQETEASPV